METIAKWWSSVLLVAACLLIGYMTINAPAQSIKPATTPPASVALTHEEGLEIELNQEKLNNLSLQAERVERQIAEARKGLTQETSDLTTKFAKAHGLDPAKYRLDPQAKSFVPLPPAPPAPTEVKGGKP